MDGKLSDTTMFMPSSEVIPSLGFSATLNFNSEGIYPTASTCGIVLTLPPAMVPTQNSRTNFSMPCRTMVSTDFNFALCIWSPLTSILRCVSGLH